MTSPETTAAWPDLHVTLADDALLPVKVIRPRQSLPRVLAEMTTVALFVAFRAWMVLVVLRHFDLAQFGYLDALMVVLAAEALRGIPLDYLSWTHALGRRR